MALWATCVRLGAEAWPFGPCLCAHEREQANRRLACSRDSAQKRARRALFCAQTGQIQGPVGPLNLPIKRTNLGPTAPNLCAREDRPTGRSERRARARPYEGPQDLRTALGQFKANLTYFIGQNKVFFQCFPKEIGMKIWVPNIENSPQGFPRNLDLGH